MTEVSSLSDEGKGSTVNTNYKVQCVWKDVQFRLTNSILYYLTH